MVWYVFLRPLSPELEAAPGGQKSTAVTIEIGHSVENFFVSAQIREFFSAIIVYYQKEVILPNGNQNSCSTEKLFYQKLEFFEWNY
jgi:hypothetical protein